MHRSPRTRRSIHARALVIALACVLAPPAATAVAAGRPKAQQSRPAACSAAHVSVRAATVPDARAATLCLLNRQRARHDLPPLRLNERLSRAALAHSRDMVHRGFFSHDAPNGRSMVDRVRAVHYLPRAAAWAVGENIGWGTGPLAEPAALVRAWMRSPGHRANILDRRYREIGIGIALGVPVRAHAAEHGATYTTDFGYRSGR